LVHIKEAEACLFLLMNRLCNQGVTRQGIASDACWGRSFKQLVSVNRGAPSHVA